MGFENSFDKDKWQCSGDAKIVRKCALARLQSGRGELLSLSLSLSLVSERFLKSFLKFFFKILSKFSHFSKNSQNSHIFSLNLIYGFAPKASRRYAQTLRRFQRLAMTSGRAKFFASLAMTAWGQIHAFSFKNSRKVREFSQIFQIFTQKFTNFANSLIKFKDFKFLWIASTCFRKSRNDELEANFLSTPRNDGVEANSRIFTQKDKIFPKKFTNFIFLWIASAFSTPRNDGVGADSRIYSSFAIARNDEQAGKFAAPYLKRREFTTPYIRKARNYNLSYSFPCFSVSAN